MPLNINNLGSSIPNILGKLPKVAAAIQSSKNSRSPAQAQLKHPSDKTAYGMYFKFNKTNYKLDGGLVNPGMKATLTREIEGAHIFLPLPKSGIIENQNMTYQTQSIGPIMQMISLGAKVGTSLSNITNSNMSVAEATSKFGPVEAVDAGVTVGSVVGRSMLNGLGGVGAAFDMMTGNVVNPFQLALFESVSPRSHTLTFTLIPRNKSESATIRKIINTFKSRSLPSFNSNRMFLEMPDEVEMAFYGTKMLFKFAPAYITSVSVNYSPFGTNAFYGDDNAPAGVELTLTFQEIEPLTRESYKDDDADTTTDVTATSEGPSSNTPIGPYS